MAEGDIRTDDKVWYENFVENYLPGEKERIGPGSAPKPEALIHISLGTSDNYEKMVDFYVKFFNCTVTNYRDKRAQGKDGGRACFISFDAFDHRFAILERKGSEPAKGRAGIAHAALILPAGEATKGWAELARATEWLLEQKVERLDAEIEAIRKIYKRVKIEEYDGMFYIFDVETDEFLGQGRTAEEFVDRLKHNLVLQPVEGDPDVIARFRKTIPQTDLN